MSMWSELPPDILNTITQKQHSYVDYVSIRSVCKSWRSAIPKKPHALLRNLPWLLLPYHKDIPDTRGFYDLHGKTYFLEMGAAHERRCCGSSHGWLIMVETSPAIFLLNPLTKAKIELPSLSTFPNFPTQEVCQDSQNLKEKIRMRETYIRKAIISEDPSTTTNFIVMAIYSAANGGENLAFCRSSDVAWLTIPETSPATHYRDIMFYSGKFFVVDDNGQVSVCNIENHVPITLFADSPISPDGMGNKQWYLGYLNEDLLLLGRIRQYGVPDFEYQTVDFLMFKLDMSISRWSELKILGDNILFLGWNSFHSISPLDYRNSNCSGTFIYYTDDYMRDFDSNFGPWEGHDFGIFILDGDNRIALRQGLIYPTEVPPPPCRNIETNSNRDRSIFILPPPVWVLINP